MKGAGMIGAIIGDIVGSPYEFLENKEYWFPPLYERRTFTDDTVMTLAVAKALMAGHTEDEDIKAEVIRQMRDYGRKYPYAGYGGMFSGWLIETDPKPYNSYGNGSGMRVSSVGWLYDDINTVLHIAKLTAEVTHNHPEGIKGAQAIAACVYFARTGQDKNFIRKYVTDTFGYDLDRTVNGIRENYSFDVTCQGSVPEAIICFLESMSFGDAIRNAVSLGGNADTLGCMAGAIAEAYYGIEPSCGINGWEEYEEYLPDDLLAIVNEFNGKKLPGMKRGLMSRISERIELWRQFRKY